MNDHEEAVAEEQREDVADAAMSAEGDADTSRVQSEATAGADGAEGTSVMTPEELASRIAELERERDEYLDQWRRSAAEFQNFRKREERLRTERERSGNARLLLKLLPVLDDLQRAANHVPEDLSGNEWIEGMLAIERKLWTVLEQEGVSPIEAERGTEFDPKVHEALVAQPNDEVESGRIIEALERGYRHHDAVLRPARVVVAQ